MWKIFLCLLFILKLVQSLDTQGSNEFVPNSIDELNNLQEKLLKVMSKIPEFPLMVHGVSSHRFIKGRKSHQIPIDFNRLLHNVSIENQHKDNITEKYGFNYTDIESLKSNSTGSKCDMDLIYLTFNIYKSWAIQMLDAAGKYPSGVSKGNILWLGDFKQCRNVTVPSEIINNIHFGGFKGKYCSMTSDTGLKISLMEMVLRIGLCVPDSCTEEILNSGSKELAEFLNYVPFAEKIANFTDNSEIVCQDSTKKWESGQIAYMCVLSIFAFIIVIGTLCDIIIEIRKNVFGKPKDINAFENHNSIETTTPEVNNYTRTTTTPEVNNRNEIIINSEITPERNETSLQKENPGSEILQFFLCFSIYTNGIKILNTKDTGNQLQCIHGIRFLSMSWIILGHTFLSSLSVTANLLDFLNFVKSFSALFIIQATFSVDTFFLLSGLLLSYLFLKNYEGRNEKVNWIYYYLHRIWRLTPVYIMVLGLYTTIWLRMGNGPLWPKEADNGNCKSYWWRNLLYIQNFKSISEMCMGWTWYLANDMQFYIISPLFLILLWKFPYIGFVVLYVVLGISSLTTGILAIDSDIYSLYSWIDSNTSGGPDVTNLSGNFFDDLYDKPYCRIGPYLIGIATGYALHKMKDCKKVLNKTVAAIGWIAAIALCSSVMFGIYHTHMTSLVASVYCAFSRTTWTITVAWVIFACLAGFGGVINTILSWKVWIPLSRLTYSAYLVHPIVIGGYFSSLIKPMYFQLNSMITCYLGILISSYMAAFVVSVVFESPMMALEKFILKKCRRNQNR